MTTVGHNQFGELCVITESVTHNYLIEEFFVKGDQVPYKVFRKNILKNPQRTFEKLSNEFNGIGHVAYNN